MKVADLITYLQTLPPEILDSDLYLKERGIIRKAEIFRVVQEYVGSSDPAERYYSDRILNLEKRTILEIR